VTERERGSEREREAYKKIITVKQKERDGLTDKKK
jgi:hypothetical protein